MASDKSKKADRVGTPKVSGDTGGEKSGRQIQHGQPEDAGRGASVQGPRQDARGGPAGANQGGAPRGGSRVEPSHQKDQQKKEGGSRK
ncbi:MAG TPA: hypothetical protein VFF69_11465 [Phycisphaerales bacterium]|nr:hypothetical protein [Phycisphaerales bacterium]